jgi:mercuric ion transport protein
VSARRDRAAVVGIGAAACAVCCAGPILGLLAAIGLGTAAGFALFGVLALAIAVATGVVLYFRRRRRRTTCTPGQEVVQVEPPRVRAARGAA